MIPLVLRLIEDVKMVPCWDNVRVVFTMSKYFGLFPYTSSGLTKTFKVISLSANAVQFLLAVSVLWGDFENKLYAQADAFRFARRISGKISFALSLVCHVYWQTCEPETVPRCLRKMEYTSAYLKCRSFTRYCAFIALVGIVCSTLLPWGFGVFARLNAFDVVFGFMVPFCGNILFLNQFLGFMEAFLSFFSDLNKRTLSAKDLLVCTQIHAELCDQVKNVNKLYFMPLLMAFVSWFINLLTQLFQVFKILETGHHDPLLLQTAPLFLVYQTLQMWIMCHICHEVYYESDSFTDTLCSSMRTKYPPNYDRKLCLYLIMRPKVKITAFHMLVIDTSMLATILGTVGTYFVVLVQFSAT